MSRGLRIAALWFALIAILLALVVLTDEDEVTGYVGYDEFVTHVESGDVYEVQVDGAELIVRGQSVDYRVITLLDDELMQTLARQQVHVDLDGPGTHPAVLLVLGIVVLVFILGIVVAVLRRMGGNSPQITALKNTRARLIEEGTVTTRFSDVGALHEAKDSLQDVIDFMRDPEPWEKAGARLPRGALLEGPPGCGKTLLARATAGEAGVHFMVVSASEFVEMFVGVGAARMRDTFEKARAEAPCILFIDEIDAIGRRRGSGMNLANDEREQTLNQLLVSLDGFASNERVMVLAATNRADILDAALLRPGRFDLRIEVGPPDDEGRLAILQIHLRQKPIDPAVDLTDIVARTEGCTGAELEQIVNAASMAAVRRSLKGGAAVRIEREDLDAGIERRNKGVQGRRPVDNTVIESGAQFTVPIGPATIKLSLRNGRELQGQLIWADPNYLKVLTEEGEVMVGKQHIQTLESA